MVASRGAFVRFDNFSLESRSRFGMRKFLTRGAASEFARPATGIVDKI